MKVTDMNNLWIAIAKKENFKILIVALDKEEAMEVARSYFDDSNMDSNPSNIDILEFDNDEDIDADYIMTA